MNRWIKTSAIVALAVGCATQTRANLLVNGSFEQPNLSGGWSAPASIPGWNAVAPGDPRLEIGAGSIYGVTGYDQNQVMELDSYSNVVAQQTISGLSGSYSLSFLYALRAGVSPSSGTLSVYWNSGLIGNFNPTTSAMTLYTTTVTGGANNTLQFWGTGYSDSYGAIIDGVSLDTHVSVPDGGSTMTFLGLGLLAVAGVRRKLS